MTFLKSPNRSLLANRNLLAFVVLSSLTACSSVPETPDRAAGGAQEETGAEHSARSTPQPVPSVAGKPARAAKNVIVMINDGAGWGTWDAAAYWQYGRRDGPVYAQFPVKLAMTTFAMHDEKKPTGEDQPEHGYDPVAAWDRSPTGNDKLPFKGYEYLNEQATDSAAAGTALASGVKTYRRAINFDNHGRPLPFVTQLAREMGKYTGVVTSVPFSHATPAAFGAQQESRKQYHEIARQMLSQGTLNLIMGTGAPGYNVNGTDCGALAPRESDKGCEEPHEYLAASDWEKLQAGHFKPGGSEKPWQVIRDRQDFEALATDGKLPDAPLIGLPKVAGNGTLQQGREARVLGRDSANPSGIAYVKTVPTLATMTQGALRYLGKAPQGFFLMVEGGATDWAAHTSDDCRGDNEWNARYNPECTGVQLGQLIEETQDFNTAVAAVVDWIEKNSSWDESLLIVTSDHDNSMPMGADAQTQAFSPVRNHGKGRMPGVSFRPTGDHSNALVPLWAKGVGAEGFFSRVRGRDEAYVRYVGLSDGRYVDNTDVHAVARAALRGEAVHSP